MDTHPTPTASSNSSSRLAAFATFSWPRALAVNFAPGIATVALIAAIHPLAERWGWPPVASYTAAIALVTLGEVIYLGRRAQQLTGRWNLRGAVTLTERLPFRRAAVAVIGFVALAAVLAGLLEPLADSISSAFAGVVPDWLDPDTSRSMLDTYGRTAVIVALGFNAVIDVIISPYVEELYWKGHLMRRLPLSFMAQPVTLALLFTAQHFWQPGGFLLVAVLQIAISIHAQRTNSLTVAIWSHWIANGVVTALTIAEVLS